MAKDVSDTVRDVLGKAVRDAVKNVGDTTPAKKSSGRFSGAKGIAAGAGLAAAAPLAKKGVDKVRMGGLGALAPNPGNLASKAGDKVGSNLKDAVSSKVDEAGGAGGMVKEAASGLLPGGGGGDGGSKNDMPGVGKGRRMPVEQEVHIGAPLETVYNQFTQFEDWPKFMHRVTRVTQENECELSFATKIWGKTKEYTAKIETQRPDERIKWRVSQGITHTGVVTFHELGPRLTMVMVTLDVDPGSLIEKAARGMRHVKRAVRADLARFKAFIEMAEMETGAWRGVIIDGEMVEPHDDDYDDERDYADIDELKAEGQEDAEGEQDSEDDEESGDDDARSKAPDDEELPRDKSGRFKRGAGARSDRELAASRSGSSSRTSRGSGSSGGSSKSKSSSSNGSSKSKSSSSRTKRQSTRSRGSSNGNGSSSSKRSSGTSSRRRTSSRS
jgi:uncharacterized membrane protein